MTIEEILCNDNIPATKRVEVLSLYEKSWINAFDYNSYTTHLGSMRLVELSAIKKYALNTVILNLKQQGYNV